MPVGWMSEAGRRAGRQAAEPGRFTWAERVRGAAQQIVVNVTGVDSPTRTLTATVWTRWETAFDEQVCSICSPYAGRVWPLSDGPQPPLHPGCRCQRRHAFVTWSVRG